MLEQFFQMKKNSEEKQKFISRNFSTLPLVFDDLRGEFSMKVHFHHQLDQVKELLIYLIHLHHIRLSLKYPFPCHHRLISWVSMKRWRYV